MLRTLGIRDFVIVDRLDLEFQPGFTALTGETGAGKSILIDALSMVLGERSDAGLVREGCAKADISAEFALDTAPAVRGWLDAADLADDSGACILRRVLERGGRSRAYINGRPATLQQLKELAELLVDIHGQHEHQSLLRAAAQRQLLDAYAGAMALAAQTGDAWRQWLALRRQREEWERNAQALEQEREQLRWQRQELERLAFSAQAWQALQLDHKRLAHAAGLVEAVEYALDALSEGEAAAVAVVEGVIARLRAAADYDPGLREQLDVLEPAQIQIQEAIYGLRHYRDRIDLDPQRLHEIERRLEAVHAVARKYRTVPDRLPELLAQTCERLAELGDGASAQALARQEQAAEQAYRTLAGKLSAARARAAHELSARVTEQMQGLAMAGGRFEAVLEPSPAGSAQGLEQVEFRVAANPGTALRPLARAASGGELSRISLAIQTATSAVAEVPTLIFDEVDAGIGGRVAEIVGRMLAALGARHQVLCVTHLPQVAASAAQQWQVTKTAAGAGVRSEVRELDPAQRVEEIARMLGGVKITETTRKHAAELLAISAGR
jgi:DNA repair protein RecN (Recombination protein N)